MGAQTAKAAEIFDAAVELGTPAERMAYLVTACGDDTQFRSAVEDLLAHDADAGSFLNQLTLADTPRIGLGIRLGTLIGPYKLLEQIGEGGMGTVFMAEQSHPVQRKVALKIIKAGMDSRQVIARFEAERQALALMDHPNIARVLDAGTTGEAAQGSPYFVMELVKGVPITRYCDDNHLKPKERLELFIPICQAVQHAHQKGIIHRDLKPSNVMICQYDGKPVPKIIDFGVAKAIRQKLTEQTLFTEFGSVVGTLEYMSPEQAELNQLDIDTRSDIYSLGVLLYELLTGTTPLEGARLKQAAFLEVLRLIREEEPPKPSTRLSTTEGLPSIAANRGSDPGKLGGLVRGELDWIVMKCLEKDRNRRYETANGLAQDIARYLADEAVQACPPSAQYRLRKFARRNKRALATAALLAGTLIVAVVLLSVSNRRLQVEQKRTTTEYHRAEAQKVVANQQRAKAEAQKTVADEQRAEAEAQKVIADEQRAEAEDRLRLIFKALDEVFVKEVDARANIRRWVSKKKTPDPQREQAEREFMEKGLRFYENLALRPRTSPGAQAEIGRAFRHVGLIQNRLGHFQESEHALRESLRLFEDMARQFPKSGEYAMERADTLQSLYLPVAGSGRDAEAEVIAGEALALLQNLPPGLREEEGPRTWLANCHDHLGQIRGHAGRIAEALPEFILAERCYDQLVIDFPRDVQYRTALAGTDLHRGYYLVQSGRQEESVAAFGNAISVFQKLIANSAGDATTNQGVGASSWDSVWYRHELGFACICRGASLRTLKRFPESEAVLSDALKVHEKLLAEIPWSDEFKSRLCWNQSELGDLQKMRGQRAGAEKSYRAAVAVMDGLNDRFLAGSFERLGDLYQEDGRIPEALEARRKNLECWEKLAGASKHRDHRMHLAVAYKTLGKVYQQANNVEAAGANYRKSLAELEGLVRERLDYGYYRANLHDMYHTILNVLPQTTDADAWKTAIDAQSRSVESRENGDANDRFFLAVARWQLGEKDDARKFYGLAVQWMEKNEPHSEELGRIRAQAEQAMEESGGGEPEKTRPKN